MTGEDLGREIVDAISQGDWLFHAVNESTQGMDSDQLRWFVDAAVGPVYALLEEIIEKTRPDFDPDNR